MSAATGNLRDSRVTRVLAVFAAIVAVFGRRAVAQIVLTFLAVVCHVSLLVAGVKELGASVQMIFFPRHAKVKTFASRA